MTMFGIAVWRTNGYRVIFNRDSGSDSYSVFDS